MGDERGGISNFGNVRLWNTVSLPFVEKMSSSQPIHICFYSNRCQFSKGFLEELKKTPYFGEFRFICVDPSPSRPALPSWLKQTPTLVISGENEPRVNNEVTNWLYEKKLRDSVPKAGAGGAKAGGAVASMEPESYNAMEMGAGFRDSYSMLDDDTSAQGNGGMSIQHSFSFLSGQDSVGTREASSFQATNVTTNRSKKEQLLDQQMEAFMRDRDRGMPQMIARQ